ncbi:MAG: hypothetical protein ISN29_09435, partial [Gammaproteobacteria bacterium AqS3]|nr:hypothetical protein [Gammaproteobacteria bacterium AqS3]
MNATSREYPNQLNNKLEQHRIPTARNINPPLSNISAPMHRRAAAAALLVIAVIAIAGQSPTAAAQEVAPAKDCAKLNAGNSGVTNNCSSTVHFVGRASISGQNIAVKQTINAGDTGNVSGSLNYCVEYDDADTQRDSGYAACPDNMVASNYTLSGSVVVGYADKLDAGFRDLPSELTLEEGASGQFTVRLTTSPEENTNDADVTVTIAQPAASTGVTIDTDTSTSNNQNTLTFTGANWYTAQTVYVSTTEDADAAVPADLTLSLSATGGGSGNNYSYAAATGSVTLKQTEKNTAALTLTPTDLDVRRDGSATFTVELQAQPTDEVEVTLTQPASSTGVTVDQTTLTFTTANWNTAQTVTVSATGTAPLGDDAATISLAASGATEYASVTGSVMIDVEDVLPALVLSESTLSINEGDNDDFMVKLNRQPSATVTVTLTAAGDLTLDKSSLMFTTDNWNVDQDVTVTARQDDDLANDTEDVSLSAANGGFDNVDGDVEVMVTDDDTAALTLSDIPLNIDEEGSGTFKVRLAYQPSATVTVTLAQPTNTDVTLDTDTSASNNQNELTFMTSNWNVDQTVTVSAADDSNTVSETVDISISAEDGGYDSVTITARVNVADNDIGLTLSESSLSLKEDDMDTDHTGTFDVQLKSQPTAEVMVTLSLGAALNNKVSISPSGPLTFTTSGWNTAQTITVTAEQDDDGANASGDINLTASGATEYVGLKGEVMVSVTDDEVPALTLTPTDLDVRRDGSNTFTVELTVQPTANVTVTLTQPASSTGVTADT